jgi:hypothetical protein
MKVLVACEESQEVTAAFIAAGHDAMSCDLYHPGAKGLPHYQGDLFDVLGDGWDLVIAHPPCTAIAVSGNRWYAGTQARCDAIAFVERIWFFEGYRGPLCIENPVGVLTTQSRLPVKPQYIQPWQFGHGETKRTGLWLRDLPPLAPTNIVCGREQRIWKMAPGPDRQRERSKTFPGIAAAMAAQWSCITTPDYCIQSIAARIGCAATICQSPADYCSDNERVIDALNEADADDRPVVDEAPWEDGFSWPGYEYVAYVPILERRRDEILSIFKEEPLTKEQASALIDELAEIETRLD